MTIPELINFLEDEMEEARNEAAKSGNREMSLAAEVAALRTLTRATCAELRAMLSAEVRQP